VSTGGAQGETARLDGPQVGEAELDERFMRLALDLAEKAGAAGEVPVGAVVVSAGNVIGRGANCREAAADPTAHAELVALREAAKAGGSWRAAGAALYVTLEPCPMCAGALVAARVSRVVFAAPDPKAGSCGSLYNLCADPRLNHEVAVTRGVLAEPAGRLLSDWFSSRRPAPQRS
jgi:tRNA(adenine34) deaminase